MPSGRSSAPSPSSSAPPFSSELGEPGSPAVHSDPGGDMVLTVLEAEVAPDREDDLRRAFAETGAGPLPPYIVRSFLVRSIDQPTRWRLMTVFRSMEDLQGMRASGETPRGVVIFNEAGAAPELSIFDVADQLENTEAR